MLKKLIFSLMLTAGLSMLAAQEITVSGTLTEEASGETLIGASVFIPETGLGTTTNEYGFYSISIPEKDSVTLQYSYIGFQPITRR
ncbi:MAG: carboxypeptidase-like regulatory domain-containing protein, partial [Caldilineaceae bacterium]|nr:carboxypeptidase-like regulatory domain-containing protein [Caldilineaceae bacterium]